MRNSVAGFHERGKIFHDLMRSTHRFEVSLELIAQSLESGDTEKCLKICAMMKEEPKTIRDIVKKVMDLSGTGDNILD